MEAPTIAHHSSSCSSKEIGFRLYKFRIARKLSQDELAKVVGVDRSQIHRYEQGMSKITLEKVEKIWNHYNVSPLLFISDASEPQNFNIHPMFTDKLPEHLNSIVQAYESIQKQSLKEEAVCLLRCLARISQDSETSCAADARHIKNVR